MLLNPSIRKKFQTCLSIISFQLFVNDISAQTSQLIKIGDSFPEHQFTNTKFLETSKVKVSSFKGKWLVLDFWGEYCSGCIASFPKIQQLKEEFRDSVQFLLVGVPYKKPQTIINLYNRSIQEKKLSIPIAFDSILPKQLGVNGFPDIFIIDPNGIVRGRTTNITKENLNKYISGVQFREHLNRWDSETAWSRYNMGKPILVNGNGGPDSSFLFRSVLIKYNNQHRIQFIDTNGRLEILGATLEELYKNAYFGSTFWFSYEKRFDECNPNINWQIRDTSIIRNSNNTDSIQRYSYSICYPESNDANHVYLPNNLTLQEMIQQDLKRTFGLNVALEVRLSPCYRLKVKTGALEKIKKNGISPNQKKNKEATTVKADITYVIDQLKLIPGSPLIKSVIIDNTGIDAPINFISDAIYFENFVSLLEANGFYLEESTTPLKTIVISDSPTRSHI